MLSVPVAAVRLERKVTSSGVIWLHGRSYYVTRRLAGRVIPVEIRDGMVVVDVMVPLRKEYRLRRRAPSKVNEAQVGREASEPLGIANGARRASGRRSPVSALPS